MADRTQFCGEPGTTWSQLAPEAEASGAIRRGQVVSGASGRIHRSGATVFLHPHGPVW